MSPPPDPQPPPREPSDPQGSSLVCSVFPNQGPVTPTRAVGPSPFVPLLHSCVLPCQSRPVGPTASCPTYGAEEAVSDPGSATEEEGLVLSSPVTQLAHLGPFQVSLSVRTSSPALGGPAAHALSSPVMQPLPHPLPQPAHPPLPHPPYPPPSLHSRQHLPPPARPPTTHPYRPFRNAHLHLSRSPLPLPAQVRKAQRDKGKLRS
jgi:hypothetical protein